MSDPIPNNPGSGIPFNNGDKNNPDMNYELITSYLDNEIKDDNVRRNIENLIETNPDFRIRYILEKLTKEKLQKSIKRSVTPLYVMQNIGKGIDDIIRKAGNKTLITSTQDPEKFTGDRSYYKRYFLYGSVVFVFLIALAFLFNSFFSSNTEELVAASRNVFEDVESGNVKIKYECKNAKELEDQMNKEVDFKVYVPVLKDAELIGGVCNEINGEKLAHFVYKKNNYLIYTMQGCKEHILNNIEKMVLNEEIRSGILSGKNWMTCTKDKDKTAVIWYSEGVICSSVAHLEPQVLTSTLKNITK